MKNKPIIILALMLCVLAPSFAAHAQFTSTIGTANFSGERFVCRTYPKDEDVQITNKKGKTRTVDKKEAKRLAQNTIQKVLRRINDAKKSIREKTKRRNKLFNSIGLALPHISKQVKNLDEDIVKLTALVETLQAQRAEMKAILAGIKNCGNIVPIGNGSTSLQEATAVLPKTGWQVYLTLAAHLFPWDQSVPRYICVSLNGAAPQLSIYSTSMCATFYDGYGTSNPTDVCIPMPPNTAVLKLAGKAGNFSHGHYDEDVEEVAKGLATSVKLSLPDDDGKC